MLVRPGRRGDAADMAAVFRAAREDATPYLPDLHTPAEDQAFLAAAVRYAEVWVAEHDGEVAGFAVLAGDVLDHLYVAPAYQGHGIGGTLLEHAKAQRPEGFRLWVFQRNERARRFYERRGFRLVELTDGAANEEREPDALYEWVPSRTPAPAAGDRGSSVR